MKPDLYNLPPAWQWQELGAVATLINGRAYKDDELLESGPVPVLRVGNFFSNRSWYYSDLQLPEDKYCNKGDLLYAWSASFGPKIWDGEKAIFHYHIWKIVTSPLLDKKYLYYLLASESANIKSAGNGIAMMHATKGGMEKRKIPLPPLAEQQKIVAILDAADSLRQQDQQLVERYTALSQSLFLEMFGDPVINPMGWKKKPLSEFIKNLNTGVSVNSTDDVYTIDRYGVLKTSCVYSGVFRPNEAKVVRDDEFERMKLNPKADSIIISRMNTPELVGKSAYVDKDYPTLFLPDRLWQAESNELQYSVRWLAIAISFESFMNEISKIASGTSGSMKNISKEKFLSLPIIYPPSNKQNQFAERIQLIEAQKQQAQLSLEKSEGLFNSLLKRVFTGKLTAKMVA